MSTTEKLEITAVDVRAFKRLEDVRIETSGHRNLLLIGGKNTAGKSSVMDALAAALGGAGELPPDPVRRGADKAEIVVELEHGRYTITRVIAGRGKDAKTSLKIVGPDGVLSSPQAWLDGLVSGRFLDPVGFLSKPAEEQRRILLTLIGVDVFAIDSERKRAFDRRTDENRALKAARQQRADVGELAPAPAAARGVDAIQLDLDLVGQQVRTYEAAAALHIKVADALQSRCTEADRKREQLAEARRKVAVIEAEAHDLDERIEAGRAFVAEAAAKVWSTEAIAQVTGRGAELRTELSRSSQYAVWQARSEARQHQLERADAEVAKRDAASKALSAELEAIDARKVSLLAAAQMPVAGLEVGEDGLALGGVPFQQASQAERLRCALAIAMRQSPRFRDVWVRDGSLLDDEGVQIVRELAEQMDCRVWLEVVGEREPGAIIIRDGKVAGAAEVAAS